MKKTYSPSFKVQVVLELLREEKGIAQISSEYGVHLSQLHKWKRQAVEGLPSVFSDDKRGIRAVKSEYEAKMEELYAVANHEIPPGVRQTIPSPRGREIPTLGGADI